MSSKTPPPLKQKNLYDFSENPSFKLKFYTHNEIAEDGTVKQVRIRHPHLDLIVRSTYWTKVTKVNFDTVLYTYVQRLVTVLKYNIDWLNIG